MKLLEAKRMALKLVSEMDPFCEQVKVAGSIRRGKGEVKDIEIVAIPKLDTGTDINSLFNEPVTVNLLHRWAEASNIRWIKPGVSEIVPWPIKPDGKYWRGLLPSGIKLDLFLAQRENWGMIYLIRTGSAEFTTAVVTHAKHMGMPCVDGFLTRDGQQLVTLEELDVFDLLQLQYVDPFFRTGFSS